MNDDGSGSALAQFQEPPPRVRLPLVLALAGAAILGFRVPPAAAGEASEAVRILVTNDDGISAPGLAALVQALGPVGDLVVVAPRENHSGIGHALSLAGPVYVDEASVAGTSALALEATPASCVRLALDAPLFAGRPALVISGINPGLNWGRNAYISGTVAAAREAALHGVPAVAISVAAGQTVDFGPAAEWAVRLARAVLRVGLPSDVFLNVSVPAGTPSVARLATQSAAYGSETFEPGRTPYGRRFWWGRFRQPSEAERGSDVWTVEHGEVAVTPLRLGEQQLAGADLQAFAREAGLQRR